MSFFNMAPFHIILIVSTLDMLSMGLIMPQLTNHALSLGASYLAIGFTDALFSASQLISALVIGSLSDIKGRKPIIISCLSVCCVSHVYLGLTSSMLMFVLFRVILGFANQIQLLTRALTPDHVEDKTNQAALYGKLAAMSGLGMIFGPILGGYIADYYPSYGFAITAFIVAMLFSFNLVLVNTLPNIEPRKKDDDTSTTDTTAPKLIDTIKAPLKQSIDEFYKIDWTVFGDIFLYKLLTTLSIIMYFSTFGLFLISEHQMSPKNLGFLVAIQVITDSICNLYIGHITHLYKNDKDFTQRNLHVFVGLTVSLISLALAPNVYVFTLLLIPLAISGAVGRIVSLEMLTNRASDDRRGTIIGVGNSIESLAGVLTALISGLVNEYLGVKYGFFIAALFTGVGIVISYNARTESLAENKDK